MFKKLKRSNSFDLCNLCSMLLVLILLLTAVVLTGCGGKISSSDGSSSSSSGSTISGVVADGYIWKATVCLDKNENGFCDTDEPSATTDNTGAYAITGVSDADKSAYSIVAYVGTSSIDMDDPTTPITDEYIMKAPKGKPEVITPITTLIHSEMIDKGYSVTEAESAIRADLGVSEDVRLFKDHIKEKISSLNSAAIRLDFEKIHSIAKIAAKSMQDNLKIVKTLAYNETTSITNIDRTELNGFIKESIDKMKAQLSTIANDSDIRDGKEITLTKVTQIFNTYQGNMRISTSTADQMKGKAKLNAAMMDAARTVSTTTLADILKDKLYNYWERIEYGGSIKKGYEEISASTTTVNSTKYLYSTTTTTFTATTTDNKAYYLETSGNWAEYTDGPKGGTISSNTLTKGPTKYSVNSLKIDCSGRPISAFLFKDNSLGTTTISSKISSIFSTGAYCYAIKRKLEADVYWAVEEFILSQSQITLAAAIIYMQGTSTKLNSTPAGEIKIKLGDGTISGTIEFSLATSTMTTPLSEKGLWEKKTVNGVDILVLKIPPIYKLWHFRDDKKGDTRQDRILAIVDGKLRKGQVTYSGGIAKVDFLYNKIGLNDVLKTMGLSEI